MKRLLIGLTVTAALAACGQPQPPASEDAAAETPEARAAVTAAPGGAPAAEVNVADGSMVDGSAGPAFAPAYPDADEGTRMSTTENGVRGGIFGFTTPDSPDKVLAFYKARAAAAGLKTSVEVAGQSYAAESAAGDLMAVATRVGGETRAQVTWTARRP